MQYPQLSPAFSWLLVLVAAVHASVLPRSTDLGSFYAYGPNITGLPVFFANDLAYIGVDPPNNSTAATNVTFSQTAQDSGLTATANSSVVLSSRKLYINISANANNGAGLTNASNGVETTVTGFRLFGGQLAWISSDGELLQKWWAAPTNQTGLWTLNWNQANVVLDGAVPVVVKNKAPTWITA